MPARCWRTDRRAGFFARTLTATVPLWIVAVPAVSFAETAGSPVVTSSDSSGISTEPAGGTSGTVAPRLEWIRETGADSCVSAAALRRMLEQTLGRNAAPWALGDSAIEGLVSKDEGPITWRARIRIVSSDGAIVGQRDLTTRQPLCSSLTPSVLLVLLMLVDPQAADRGLPAQVVEEISSQADAEAAAQMQSSVPPVSAPSVQSPPPPPPPSPPQRTPSLPVSAPPDSRPSTTLGWRFHFEPTVSVGLLPSATFGISGGVSLVTGDDWQLALSGGYGGSAMVAPEDFYTSPGGIEFSAFTVDLSVCPAILREESVALSACVGATGVRRSTRTPGLAEHTNPSRNSLGPSATVETRAALTEQWFVVARAGAAMPIPRDRFVYQDTFGATRPLYTPSRIFGMLGVGLGAAL